MRIELEYINDQIIPKPLIEGSHIRVIAPSCSGKTIETEKLERAKNVLERSGFKVSFGRNLFEYNSLQSSSIEQRLEDLHSAFHDPQIDGVMAVRGGYNANDLLNYIDWRLIRSKPKAYCGFSDNTVLENAILAKTGLITFSGPNFSTFGKRDGLKYTLGHFLNMASDHKSLEYQEQCNVINPGNAEGVIIGGNLCSLNLLQGTEFMPRLENSVIFLEDDFISEYDWWEFCRNLQSLINLPDFHLVKGLIIGKFDPKSNLPLKRIREIIKSKPALSNIPVLSGVNFGHIPQMLTFPIGGKAKIDTDREQKLSISIR